MAVSTTSNANPTKLRRISLNAGGTPGRQSGEVESDERIIREDDDDDDLPR